MKKHNTTKIVLGTVLLCFILTWIINAASFQSEFVDQGRLQMGLFDLFSYTLTSLSYFGYISLFIIVVGGFYGILYKIPAYRNMLDKMANKMKKNGMLFISIIMILLAVLTSVCGLQLGLILFFPLIASLILLMDYDKIVVALTLVGSTMVGIIGSTYAYNNISVLDSYLSTSMNDNIAVKFAILIVGLFILILNTVLYTKKKKVVKAKKVIAEEVEKEVKEEVKVVEVSSNKRGRKPTTSKQNGKSSTKSNTKTSTKSTKKSTTKKSTSKSKNNNKAASLDNEVITVKNTEDSQYLIPKSTSKKVKTWPLVCGLIILFVILVLAFIPWSGAFKLNIMSDATNAVNKFKLFGFPLFAKLFGTYNSFGEWMVTDMFFPMAFITLLLAIIYNVKLNDVIDGFAQGAKKALGPAVLALLIYVVLVINTYHPFQLTIYKFILGKGSSLNVFTSSITGMLAGILNVDSSYAFQAVLPYLTSVVTNTDLYSIIGVIYTAMYGFAMLFAPTSIILMGTLSYLGVSYKEWFKSVWKMLLELLVILLIIFTILVLL